MSDPNARESGNLCPSLNADTTIGHYKDSVIPMGIAVSVRGAVMDVSFIGSVLPPINIALIVERDRSEPLGLEVHSHVGPVTVRGIAL